jgi:hypothetical protein
MGVEFRRGKPEDEIFVRPQDVMGERAPALAH